MLESTHFRETSNVEEYRRAFGNIPVTSLRLATCPPFELWSKAMLNGVLAVLHKHANDTHLSRKRIFKRWRLDRYHVCVLFYVFRGKPLNLSRSPRWTTSGKATVMSTMFTATRTKSAQTITQQRAVASSCRRNKFVVSLFTQLLPDLLLTKWDCDHSFQM